MCIRDRYEGKAKKVFATDDADLVIVDYKDDATAGDGAKKGTIRGKGVVNNRLSNNLMKMLAEKGVPTHFVEELSDRETLVKKVEIVPLEVIIRNVAAGSFTKRLGVPEGTVLKKMCIRDRAIRAWPNSWRTNSISRWSPSRCARANLPLTTTGAPCFTTWPRMSTASPSCIICTSSTVSAAATASAAA